MINSFHRGRSHYEVERSAVLYDHVVLLHHIRVVIYPLLHILPALQLSLEGVAEVVDLMPLVA
jgi:hypothetical protein